jgi:transposase-like protein
MNQDNVLSLKKHQQTLVEDPLTETLRAGARQLLAQAVEAEVTAFIEAHEHLTDEQGRRRVVRNGYLPERQVQTGIGSIEVKVPRVRDRAGTDETRIRFHSNLLPPYLRKSKSIEALLPWLYLKGVSTGDFADALAVLLGPNAAGLSQPTISRLKGIWKEELAQWQRRDLTGKEFAYFWVDGIHCNVRLDQDKQCILVIIGATKEGRKELVALCDGYRESSQSWRELLLDLKQRGLTAAPSLAVGDGALGFWKALCEVYSGTRQQRCWVHKTRNVLNCLPRSQQARAKSRLHDIWMAETKTDAETAFANFVELYEEKYPKATACLIKDRMELLTFYDFPAQHWAHLRTTNPVESTFATVRLRTAKVRGCFSRETVLTMAFRLCLEAEKKWRLLNASEHVAKVLAGIVYIDGIHPDRIAA